MIIEEIKNIDSSLNELKKFGKSIGLLLLVLNIIFSLISSEVQYLLMSISGVIIISAFLFPFILSPFYKLWTVLSIILGFIFTRVILTIIYYFILTPIAFIGRIMGMDYLDEKIEPEKKSYWIYRSLDNIKDENIKRQF